MNAGVGEGEDFYANLVAKISEKMMPIVESATVKVTAAAEPTVRRILTEDVIPKAGFYVVIGLAGVAAVSSLIGSLVATRRR